ncbi:MAG: hypothetical protein QM765_32215 [Myxococcales bacterium]
MMPRVFARLAFLLLAAATLASCKSEAGCTVANCEAAINQCHVEPDSNAYAYCVMARAPVSEDEATRRSQAMGECVKACERAHSGDTFACIGQNAGQCSTDAGRFSQEGLQALLDQCSTPNPNPIDQACSKTCLNTFKTCILGDYAAGGAPNCPVNTMDACLGCANQCADQYMTCQDACPRQK